MGSEMCIRDMLVTSPIPDMGHRLYAPDFFARLEQMLGDLKPNVVQIEGIELARAIETVKEHSAKAKIVFDNHNAETALQRSVMNVDWKRPSRLPAALYSLIQVNRLGRFESWALQNADAITVVSENDKKTLTNLIKTKRGVLPTREIKVIPNCIDVEQYQVEEATKSFDVLFTGKMDYRPNVDAMLWFVDDVWPLVRERVPTATFGIVGQKPHARLGRLSGVDGVTVTGRVESIVPYMRGARVFAMSLRMGSGTRLKLIEAMAAGLPIVSTTVGVAGYKVVDGQHVLIGDSPHSFARAIAQLLNDQILADALSDAGEQFATAYDWRTVIPRFDRLAQSLTR